MTGGWDTTVALAFAAEELVFAAQALTTELMPPEHRLNVAHRHLQALLQHEHSLPLRIGTRLRNLNALYIEWGSSAPSGRERRNSATAETIAVLRDVRDLLHARDSDLDFPLAG